MRAGPAGGDGDGDFLRAAIFRDGVFGVIDDVDEDLQDLMPIEERDRDGLKIAAELDAVAFQGGRR